MLFDKFQALVRAMRTGASSPLQLGPPRERPRCRRIAPAPRHCARKPTDGSRAAWQVSSCAAVGVIFICERKPLSSVCPSSPPSRVDHEVRRKPGPQTAPLGSAAAAFVGRRTTPRISNTCFFAVAVGDGRRGVEATARPSSLAPRTCGLSDVSFTFRMHFGRSPPWHERSIYDFFLAGGRQRLRPQWLPVASCRALASRVLFLSDQVPHKLPLSSAARARM